MRFFRNIPTVVGTIYAQWKNKKNLPLWIIGICSLAGLWYIFACKCGGGIRHHGLILIVTIFLVWVSGEYREKNESPNELPAFLKKKWIIVLIVVSLGASLFHTCKSYRQELTMQLSGSQRMAMFLRSHNLTDKTIVAHPSPNTSSILPYIPAMRLWYADIKQFGTYVTWNIRYDKNSEISQDEVLRRIGKNFPDKKNVLLLLTTPLDKQYARQWKLLKKVDEHIMKDDEKYYLYEYKV